MFVYEKGNSLNLTFEGRLPTDTPDVVIKGYSDGATLTVNGTTYGTGSTEFEGKAKTFVYQKDNKLMITFHGIAGMSDPEVILDEVAEGTVVATVGGTNITMQYDDTNITVGENAAIIEELSSEVDPIPEATLVEDIEDEPEEAIEE